MNSVTTSPSASWLEERGRVIVERLVVPARKLLPRQLRWWLTANGVSTLRLLLTLPVHLCAFTGVLKGEMNLVIAAFVLFVPTAMLDLLDGWLARYDRNATALGGFLDSTGDKVLMLPLLALMVWRWKFPHVMVEVFVWGLIVVDCLNFASNVHNFVRATIAIPHGDSHARALKALFASYAGKMKLWTQAIVCGAFFFCISLPEEAGWLPEFLNFIAVPVAFTCACLSLFFKVRSVVSGL
jgi:phosphatidylglycerophosphate synthase